MVSAVEHLIGFVCRAVFNFSFTLQIHLSVFLMFMWAFDSICRKSILQIRRFFCRIIERRFCEFPMVSIPLQPDQLKGSLPFPFSGKF